MNMAAGAMESNAGNAGTANSDPEQNLDHIYFFLERSDRYARPHASSDSSNGTIIGSAWPKSRDSSPDSTGTGSSATVTGSASSSTSSSLNPAAVSFFSPSRSRKSPRSPSPCPAEHQLYEICEVPGKGLGLVAIDFIPRGTRIICEEPLLAIPQNAVPLAWTTYSMLDPARKELFDKLHSSHIDAEGFENTSRLSLIDYSDPALEDEEALDALVADQVRVMSTFSTNCFNLVPEGLAVYAIASRLNHSCAPNSFHGYNPNIERFTVHAVRDIVPGEELTVNYMGSPADFMIRSQRLEIMRTRYGFTCTCSSCADCSGESDKRREFFNCLCWGLEQYEQGAPFTHWSIPDSPARALYNTQHIISTLNAEGLQSLELGKAFKAASSYALAIHDWASALEYAKDEQDVERACLGQEVKDLQRNGESASYWMEKVQRTIREAIGKKKAKELIRERLRGPANEESKKQVEGRIQDVPAAAKRKGKQKVTQEGEGRTLMEKDRVVSQGGKGNKKAKLRAEKAAEKALAERQAAEKVSVEQDDRKEAEKLGEEDDTVQAERKPAHQRQKAPSTWAQIVAAGAASVGSMKGGDS